MKQLIFTFFAVCMTFFVFAQAPIVTITSPSGGAQLARNTTYQVNYTVTPYNITLGGWFFPGPVVEGTSPDVNGGTTTCVGVTPSAVTINGSNAYFAITPGATTPFGNCMITVKGCTYQPFPTVVCATSTIGVNISSILAVQLSAFNGKYEQNSVNLTWSTDAEKSTDRFEITRSNNGVQFETLGTIKAAGTANAKTAYSFEDKTVNATGLVYYRLNSIDVDGKTEKSKIIAVYTGKSESISVSAVLNGDTYTVRANSNDENGLTVRLSDVAGRVMSEQKFASVEGANEYQVSAASLNNGIYLLTVSNGTQATTVKVVR